MITHKQQVLKKMRLPPDSSPSLEVLSGFFNVPISILREIEKRAGGAFSHNFQSVRLISTGQKGVIAPKSEKMSINQWKRARIYSFLNKGKTYHTADSDLAKKARF